MKSFITPTDCKISYTEFSDLVKTEIQKSHKEWVSEPINERDSFIQTWVYIPHCLYPYSYLECLKEDLKAVGWENFKVEQQTERGEKLYIFLKIE